MAEVQLWGCWNYSKSKQWRNFSFASVQEPSTLQATEALAASIGDISVSRSLQRGHLYFSRDNSVSVELLRRLVSFSVPSLTMELERAQMQVSAQSDKLSNVSNSFRGLQGKYPQTSLEDMTRVSQIRMDAMMEIWASQHVVFHH